MRVDLLGRWLGRLAWLSAALWLARETLWPAPLRAVRLAEVGGNDPYLATLRWRYGRGARPVSVIFDLVVGPATGSVTVDGDESEAVLPLGPRPQGSCTITSTATYRIFGVAYVRVATVSGQF
ncbi:MAG: hypothetical protein AB4911_09090 [Oscillochloridaceae bacterium umkhey_bin13]